MSYRELQVASPDGRVIEVATVGDPAGLTVFYHHGTPGSAPLVKMFARESDQTGLFFVTMSRAGYGLSSRREGRSIGSIVDDVRTVLDALGRDTYVAVGWSGGGPHALACAALDAPRCLAAWSLAGVVPIDVDFDWTEGMGPENLEEFALSKIGGPDYERHIAQEGEKFAHANADNIIELFGGLLSDVDKAALAEVEARTVLAEACCHAFVASYTGFFDDDRAFFAPWGFAPSAITVPVNVWYGDHDLMVPPTHGAWLAKSIPTAKVTHKPQEGHISLATEHMDELVASFAKAFRT
jgi:pimeloyl-ACP methyl ester carboxylesterase